MLIQLGLFFIERLNKSARSEYEDYIDITEEIIQGYIDDIKSVISEEEEIFKECYVDEINTKKSKTYLKEITDKKILLEAFENLKQNYFKKGIAMINIIVD